MKVISEEYLRNNKFMAGDKIPVDKGDIVLESAKDYAKKNGMRLVRSAEKVSGGMPVDIGPQKGYIDAVTGARYSKKPEDMTHLRSNLLVKKDHPRIVFRGKLDSLEAKIITAQSVSSGEGNTLICDRLDEVLSFIRTMLGCEVKEERFKVDKLFGLDENQIHEISHHPEKYFGIGHLYPSYKMGRLFCVLNELRTCVREAELKAVTVFADRQDMILGLNRLSSAIYLLELMVVSGKDV